jgi:sulfide:quinone oxidoreductase
MTVSPFRVIVAGGGVAGIEALLTLHALAGDRCELTLLDPEPMFVYRPLAVAEPFLLGEPRRYPLGTLARDVRARLVTDGLAGVDDAERVVMTRGGQRLPYDALLLATGARSIPAYRHALNWDERAGNEQLRGLLADIEGGYVRRLAFVIPPGPGWPLPAYELALLTRGQAWGMQMEPEITLVSPEPAPLAVFGTRARDAVAADLAAADIRFEGGVQADVEHGQAATVLLHPRPDRLEVDRVVALPRLAGRAVDGVPGDAEDFVTVDGHGRVAGLERVWAAGDGIAFPIKFGGLAAEQADAAAEAIAALAGADVTPEPFRPVLRGRLMTGRRGARYLHHAAAGGGGEGTTAEHALWWPPGKIAGRRLSPYLAQRDEAAIVGPERPVGMAVQADLVREPDIPAS